MTDGETPARTSRETWASSSAVIVGTIHQYRDRSASVIVVSSDVREPIYVARHAEWHVALAARNAAIVAAIRARGERVRDFDIAREDY